MKSICVRLLVWSFLAVMPLSAQEPAAPESTPKNLYQSLFLTGEWDKALEHAGDDLDRKVHVYWRAGMHDQIQQVFAVAEGGAQLPGDRVRLCVLRDGPKSALQLGKDLLKTKQDHHLLAVETLIAAVEAGSVKDVEALSEALPDAKDLDHRSLERLCWIQPRVAWLLESPDLAREATVDFTQMGIDKYDWNPRFLTLKVLNYFRAGQRIDAKDWAAELLEIRAQDPLFLMMPPEAGLGLTDMQAAGRHFDVLVHRSRTMLRGVESFTGVQRLNGIEAVLAALKTIAPRHPETLCLESVVSYVKGTSPTPPVALKDVTFANGRFWQNMAEVTGDPFDRSRALPWGRKACEAEPWNVDFLISHGVNCHREGLPEEALDYLDRAHKLEPRMSQVWNLRTLIRGTLKNFIHHQDEHFDLRIRRDEWKPFKPLLLPEIKSLLSEFEKRYEGRPDKLHFVMYSDKQDFDVSVFMVPSAPAIGACMGRLVTMPSPAYLQYKTEPWAPVLRHEIAHAYHVHVSGGRVTRWFTEGLAHYEEAVARDAWDWEEGYDQKLVDLLATNKLARFGALDAGFQGEDVRFYYQYCRWIMQWLDETHGWQSVLDCLKAYAGGTGDDKLFEEVIALDNEAAERAFRAWLNANVVSRIPYPARVPGPLKTPGALALAFSDGRHLDILKATGPKDPPLVRLWHARSLELIEGGEAALPVYESLSNSLKDDFLFNYLYGRNLAEGGRWADAVTHLEKAAAIYPDRVKAADNPWYWLYKCHTALEQPDRAFEAVWKFTRIQQKDHRARFWLIRRCHERGDWGKARVLLREILEIHPYHFEAILWRAEQARRENDPKAEKAAYERLYATARLEQIVDQETLWSDTERLEFLKKAIRPWLSITEGADRQQAADIISDFFPKNPDVEKALVNP